LIATMPRQISTRSASGDSLKPSGKVRSTKYRGTAIPPVL